MREILFGHIAMSIHSPDYPFFLPPRTGENKGVDFLGLRQTNLDMMAEMIPSINNVTDYIRPFSLVCWVFWKFYALCSEKGLEEASPEDINRFRERIEVLFSWGASMHQTRGRIPGTGAKRPASSDDGRYPLTFKDWKRRQSSTSLIAALWYGPATKIVTGLGFLMPVPGKTGLFRVTGLGIHLAEALDAHLRSDDGVYHRLLATLDPVAGSEEDAIALWKIWTPDLILDAERAAFLPALFSEDEIGELRSLIGKRSTTLALAIEYLRRCSAPANVSDVRHGMALSVAQDGSRYTVPDLLVPVRNSWLSLQMRQLQRLSMESILSWCENCILTDRVHDTATMAQRFSDSWDSADKENGGTLTVSEIVELFDEQSQNIDGFTAAIDEGRLSNPFELMRTIQTLFKVRDPAFVHQAFLGLLLCVAYAGAAESETNFLRMGAAQRVSLDSLRRRILGLGAVSVREAFQYILEALIVSQHFSTAVNRFDGRNQRLRLTIEETGLEVLVGKAWEPTVTEDRLATLLSLAAQSGLLVRHEDGTYAVAEKAPTSGAT